MKKLCQHVQDLAFEIGIMGVSHEGYVCMCRDDQSVLANDTILDFELKKKFLSLAYHLMREGADMDD